VAGYRDLQAALSNLPATVTRISGRVSGWTMEENGVSVDCRTGTIHAQLLVLADGGAPHASADAGNETVKAYGQSAIVCDLLTEKPHADIAWERFSSEGPLALLPFRDHHAMVWTLRTPHAEQLLGLDEPAFLAAAQLAFGYRLGRFLSAGPRAAFALSMKHRHGSSRARVIPIGNAAQTLHPVAGQGLNLGLRDAWELAELATDADWPGSPSAAQPGSAAFAHAYASRRQLDRRTMAHMTDGLISAFGINLPFAPAVRGAALAFLDMVPPARRLLSRRMMFGARALP
jgi:2-octaprenyl-6-methoxyphenol hydroxylase